MSTLLLLLSLVSAMYALHDVPSKYTSPEPVLSLFCNVCGVLTNTVNSTLFDGSADFETLVGFRLDSSGKKIRKNSAWLKLYLSLEDICDSWKSKYRVAKRTNDSYLYLIENDIVNQIEREENERKADLEREESEKLYKKWEEQKNENETETDSKSESRYIYLKKPKLLKKKSKRHKLVKEMCFFLNEKFDEWLHEQQTEISQKMNEGDRIRDFLKPISFCLEGDVCKENMFDVTPAMYRFKTALNLPTKPKPTTQSDTNATNEDYEEEMEDDNDVKSDADNIDNEKSEL